MLEKLFSSGARLKLLKLFLFSGPDDCFYIRQLARELDLQDGAASMAEPLLWQGRCTSMSGHDLRAHISRRLGREALLPVRFRLE